MSLDLERSSLGEGGIDRLAKVIPSVRYLGLPNADPDEIERVACLPQVRSLSLRQCSLDRLPALGAQLLYLGLGQIDARARQLRRIKTWAAWFEGTQLRAYGWASCPDKVLQAMESATEAAGLLSDHDTVRVARPDRDWLRI